MPRFAWRGSDNARIHRDKRRRDVCATREHRRRSAADAFGGEIRILGPQRNNVTLPVCA